MDVNEQLELLRNDLAAFADPGTEVMLKARDGLVAGTWQQDGRKKTATFLLRGAPDLSDVVVRPEGSDSPRSYAAFLASDRMGDLRALARNTLQVVLGLMAYAPPSSRDVDEDTVGRADEVVLEIASERSEATRVIFITADAGVGKTSLLKYLVRESASSYLAGHSSKLWLYVNAQGSRLARLDQALAQTLDDLRARFPYHATGPLVRTGSVVLVVDGFDELIGTQGSYDEAFSSLASFIGTLRGSGTIVAAARSAYYEQEFATRAGSSIGFPHDPWSLRLVALNRWSPDDRHAYLERLARAHDLSAAEASRLASAVEATFADPTVADLATRPLLVSRIAELQLEGKDLESGGDLVERLVSTYVKREVTEKLLSPTGKPWLSVAELRDFYAEIANEMWRQETRELSRATLRELIDILADLHGIDSDGRMAIVERAPYSALMVSGSVAGSVAFEHDLYFAYFLAEPIVRAIETLKPQSVGLALRKGQLPEQAAYLAGQALAQSGVQLILNCLAAASDSVSTGGDQIRRNAGLVVAGLLTTHAVQDGQIRALDFVDCDLTRSRLEHTSLSDCTFRGSDIRGARWSACHGANIWFDSVLADRTTLIELIGVAPSAFLGLRFDSADGERRTLYSPEDLRNALDIIGLPSAKSVPANRSVNGDVVRLVGSLARIYMRTNLVTPTDNNMWKLVDSPAWPRLEAILKTDGIMAEEIRPSSGYKTFFRLLVRPRDLLAGQTPQARVDGRILSFWDHLESEFPAQHLEAPQGR